MYVCQEGIGDKALAGLRDNPDFAALAAGADEIAEKLDALKQLEAELIGERDRREREEKMRLLRLTCFACKTVNSEGANFCENCGGKLGEPPREFCNACGSMNGPNMNFCGECGAKLDAASTQ